MVVLKALPMVDEKAARRADQKDLQWVERMGYFWASLKAVQKDGTMAAALVD